MKSATVLFAYVENGADYGKENGRCDYPGLSSGRRMETDAARTGRTDLAGTPPDRDEYRKGKLESSL